MGMEIRVLGMNINDKLSPHFTLKEFLASQTAKRKGIPNIPDEKQVRNMKALCTHLLEKIRTGLREKQNSDALVMLSSGFRSAKLNKKIGGSSKKSQHMKGQAADFHVWGVSLFDAFKYIVCDSNLEFDQCIWEFGGWIHISYNNYGVANRNQILSVKKVKKGLIKKSVWRSIASYEVRNME